MVCAFPCDILLTLKQVCWLLQATMLKVQEASSKIQEAGAKMTESDLQSIQGRADVITYSVLAEMQHFHQYRAVDFKAYLTNYLQGQINFYKAVSVNRTCLLTNVFV